MQVTNLKEAKMLSLKWFANCSLIKLKEGALFFTE